MEIKMKSRSGFLAALVLLLALPIVVLYQLFFANGTDTLIHVELALGAGLMAFAVFDFKLPSWITWIGCLSMSALAVIFLLQGVSHLIQNDTFTYLAYPVLGVQEGWLMDLFIGWCMALALMASQGKTQVLGFVAVAVIGLEVYRYSLAYLGTAATAQPQALRLIYLLLFVWLLFESTKPLSPDAKRATTVTPQTLKVSQ
jgi:hypothetical protein